MIIVPKKLAFIHMQRTGGTTISNIITTNFSDWKKEGKKHSGTFENQKAWDDNSLFKFAFVRNTWDRLVSWHTLLIDPKQTIPWAKHIQRKGGTFELFIQKCLRTKRARKKRVDQLSKLRKDGKMTVDFIGSYEQFHEDTITVFRKLGLNLREQDIPHLCRTEHPSYQECYTEKTKKIVQNVFSEEIEFFGFKFE